MEPLIPNEIITSLLPVLSDKEKQEMRIYFMVYEKYHEEFSALATKDLEKDPDFGKLVTGIPKEVADARNKVSLDLQKDAIVNDNWEPYVKYQIEQGIAYAKMNIPFRSWYKVIALFRNYIVPYLRKEYGTGEVFLSAVSGLNIFMDVAMGILGEAYMEEKRSIIAEDQKQLRALNESLEQKVAERAEKIEQSGHIIKEREEKYRALFNSIDEGYCIIEVMFDKNNKPVDYIFLEINASFEKQTGLIDAVGKRMREFAPNHEEHWFEIYGKIALTGEPIRFENRAEQLHRWYDVYAFRYGEPEKRQVAILFNDITDRKQSEKIINQLNKDLENNIHQLQVVNKELEAFTYSVSHDLRAPLRAISGYSEILTEDYQSKLDEEGKRILGSISYNAIKMGTLIDQLLTFSRLGKKEIQLSSVDMNELAEGVIAEINKTMPHHAKILAKPLPVVSSDFGLLYQVLFNLVANAVKYSSKKDEPVIEISSETSTDEVIISVKDNGAGFDMKYYNKLFGVFQRLHSDEDFQGTGVGLAIVQRIIAKHGGRVWAEGKTGQGAVFSFSLPKTN